MQTFAICMKCQQERGVPDFSTLSLARIPDDGVIDATCAKGHRTFTIIQEMKFEILSDMAIKAIIDGYYRDAIASFIGALERLYEFFTEATCRKRGIGRDAFSAAWKPLANLSERQLGAFFAAFLIETGNKPKLLPQSQTKLRNDVIHKGKFPDREETVYFGQAVLECAAPVLEQLKSETFKATVQELIRERLGDRFKRAQDAQIHASTCSIHTLFSLNRSQQGADIEAEIAKQATRPNMDQVVHQSHAIAAFFDLMANPSAKEPHD